MMNIDKDFIDMINNIISSSSASKIKTVNKYINDTTNTEVPTADSYCYCNCCYNSIFLDRRYKYKYKQRLEY